ncbi:MAG: diadenylate cyclase CdaA [Desulfuromusa sp.]|nr:diadenylate cyclase CdaA [Desulfuromusa sp.]
MLDVLTNIRLLDILDVCIVAFIIYRIILLIKGTRAVQMVLGLVVVFVFYVGSRVGDLHTLNWFLSNFLSSIILVIVVIFQNDIRRALMHVGRNPFFGGMSSHDESAVIDELVKACVALGSRKIGALIAIERENGINDILESGTSIDARVSCELIRSIFMPSSPIHDGALVVQQGRLTLAGSFLPLSRGLDLTKDLGTRHRAAVGLTELADAVAIVVSEETGNISVAVNGGMTRNLDAASLKKVLGRLLEPRRVKTKKKIQQQQKKG